MSAYIIIDGYNVLYWLKEKLQKELNRDSLISLLGKLHRKKLIVVFDSKQSNLFLFSVKKSSSGVKIIFTEPDKSADEKIEELVRKSKNPQNITVVSNDRGLHRRVRSYHAKVCFVEDFLKSILEEKKKIKDETNVKNELPVDIAEEITEELKKFYGVK